jgi:hypothetical protein
MRACLRDDAHVIPDDASPERLYCSNACRQAAYRHRVADRQAHARALLFAQTRAIIAQDHERLAAIVAEIEALLGEEVTA